MSKFTFRGELWKVLTRPFTLHSDGETKKFVTMLEELMDEAKDTAFEVRRQWSLKYAKGWVLDIRGAERGLLRWYGENDDDYRKRVEGAFALYAAGGTLPGMKRALAQIGYGDAEIEERTPTWARFKITLDFPMSRPMGRRERDILNFSVWRMKPAHTMPMYMMTFRPDPPQKIQMISKPSIFMELKTSHPIWWLGKNFYYIDGSLTLNGGITLGDGWCEATYLDGKYPLGGVTLLDGFTAVEDDGWRWRDNALHRPRIEMEIGPIRPFANQTYRLDGREILDGDLFLDALKVTNTKIAHHRTFIEIFDLQGNSHGREELQ